MLNIATCKMNVKVKKEKNWTLAILLRYSNLYWRFFYENCSLAFNYVPCAHLIGQFAFHLVLYLRSEIKATHVFICISPSRPFKKSHGYEHFQLIIAIKPDVLCRFVTTRTTPAVELLLSWDQTADCGLGHNNVENLLLFIIAKLPHLDCRYSAISAINSFSLIDLWN